MTEGSLLEVADLTVRYRTRSRSAFGGRGSFRAVDAVNLAVGRGECVALVGESGSGKSTLARTIVRLIEPATGTIRFDGTDVTSVRGADLRSYRRCVQMVFQDPYGSMNPRSTVRDVIGEPLANHHRDWSAARRRQRVEELLDRVHLPRACAGRGVTSLSGGQLQRIGIARALAPGPRLLVADEPVSALDVSIQAQILNLFQEIKQDLGLASIFITHNLAVAEYIADRIAVMYTGRIVEIGESDTVVRRPSHPYTRELIASVAAIDGEPPPRHAGDAAVDRLGAEGHGCSYAPRCRETVGLCACRVPDLMIVGSGQLVACHVRAEESSDDEFDG